MDTENRIESLKEFKAEKRHLEEHIANLIRKFNEKTGERIQTCFLHYLQTEPGMTTKGEQLHDSGGCIKVQLKTEGL